MFGLLEMLTKLINDQAAEYAALQADMARRYGHWLNPFAVCQPARIRTERRSRDAARRQR